MAGTNIMVGICTSTYLSSCSIKKIGILHTYIHIRSIQRFSIYLSSLT